jgi:LPXTG-motif cell wall-anchored protein
VAETTTSVASETPTTPAPAETTTSVASLSPGGELPSTGSDMSVPMLAGGLALLGGGAVVMAMGRRQRRA